MKFSRKYKMAYRTRLMLAMLAICLAACGDSEVSSGVGSSGKNLSGPATGKLMDAAVSGVNYSTSSKIIGTTDKDGIYKYNHGDTVKFKLGSLILGETKAAAIVTPINLAGDRIFTVTKFARFIAVVGLR